jgi:phospholipid transport system substrate-binding protein
MIRLVVGPTWSGAAEDRRQQATAAFARYIAATYADRFASYNGQQLEVIGAQPHGSDAVVDSRIVRSSGEAVMIRYILHLVGADWRVIDVYLDGTISELATRHSEFASILQRNGVDGLIAALNQKSDTLVPDAAK